MCELKICRICLRTKCRMYKYDQYQLKQFYEQLTAIKIDEADILPHYFCYECATLLHKFHKFKQKCYVARNVLKDICHREKITYEAVATMSQYQYIVNLNSPIRILTVNKRVRTYCITERSEYKLSQYKDIKEEIVSDDDETVSNTDLSDDSVMDVDYMEPEIDLAEVNKISSNLNKEIIVGELMKHANDEVLQVIGNDECNSPETIIIDMKSEENDYNEEIKDEKQLSNNFVNSSLIDTAKRKSKSNVQFKVKTSKILDKSLKSGKINRRLDVKRRKKTKRTSAPVIKAAIARKRRSKNNTSKKGTKKIPYVKEKKIFLDMTHWQKSVLTEDEARKEFMSKAQDAKYLASEHKCTDCFKYFLASEKLLRHRKLIHSETNRPLECYHCHMRFRMVWQVTKHMRLHYNKFHCLRCNLVCNQESTAIMHDDFHNGKVRKCKECGEEYTHSTSYYTHLRTHRTKNICTLCGKSFVSPLGLYYHKKVKHVNDVIEVPDEGEDVNTFCEKCDIRFETKQAYDQHVFHSPLHTDTLKPVSQPRRKPRPFVDVSRKSQGRGGRRRCKPTACYQCELQFDSNREYLEHHMKEHPGTSIFPPDTRAICEICGASLAAASMAIHQNMHTREIILRCEICGREFHNSTSLKRHMVTHTGVKKYPCPLCEKRFTQSGSMKLHYRTFHLKEPYPKRNRRKKQMSPEPVDSKDKSSEAWSDLI